MTDREAIGIIITERDLYCPKKRYEAFDKAISALRERDKRSKGCEFCYTDAKSNPFVGGYNYCPMCGRELKGATQND